MGKGREDAGVVCAGVFVQCVVCCVCAPIFFGLLYGIVLKDKDTIDNTVQTTCLVNSSVCQPYKCCGEKECDGCNTCAPDTPTCGQRLASKSNGLCCDGYHCCQDECATCCETVYTTEEYECRCSEGSCDTCTRTVSHEDCYQCNCRCTFGTSNRECHLPCGRCMGCHATILAGLKDGSTRSFSPPPDYCDEMDNTGGCTFQWFSDWPQGKKMPCYYDGRDPQSSEILLESPKHNIPAIVFVAIAGLPLGCFVLCDIFAACLLCLLAVGETGVVQKAYDGVRHTRTRTRTPGRVPEPRVATAAEREHRAWQNLEDLGQLEVKEAERAEAERRAVAPALKREDVDSCSDLGDYSTDGTVARECASPPTYQEVIGS